MHAAFHATYSSLRARVEAAYRGDSGRGQSKQTDSLVRLQVWVVNECHWRFEVDEPGVSDWQVTDGAYYVTSRRPKERGFDPELPRPPYAALWFPHLLAPYLRRAERVWVPTEAVPDPSVLEEPDQDAAELVLLGDEHQLVFGERGVIIEWTIFADGLWVATHKVTELEFDRDWTDMLTLP